MPNVVFVVPFALDTTLRFVRAVASLPGVTLGIVSQAPADRLPADLRERIGAFAHVTDALDPAQITLAVRSIARQWGGRVDRLLGILEQLQEPLAETRERLGIRGMDLEEARNFRDKNRMKDVLRAADLPCARHGLAESAGQAVAFARSCGFPLVAKPPSGAGAKNTFRVDTLEQLESWLRTEPPSAAEPLMLEEFITGREHSFDSVTINGRHVFHSISRYYPTPLEVMEVPWLQWCVVLPRRIDVPEFEDITRVGRRTLDALGMVTGVTHMEWFRREDRSLAISEVAARPPGAQFSSLISWAHGIDFYRAWAQVVVFETFEVPERRWAVGAVYLRGQGSGRVQGVEGFEDARRELGDLIVEARLPARGQERATNYEGEGFVILRADETEAVEDGLRRLLKTMRVEIG